MRIIVAKDYDELSKKAASILAGQILLKSNSVLGLATGSTPIGTYKELVRMYQEGIIDFEEIVTFNLDEYHGLSRTNEQSYYYFMNEHLFRHINIQNQNIHIPNGITEDIEGECERYEEEIKKKGGIDFQLLGIGRNGHIGFNEPDVKFEAVTHLVTLDQDTIDANARFFDNPNDVPHKAISMGIKTIMHSKKIILLASGAEKAKTIHAMIRGNITPELPASILQLHQDATVILDEAAAELL
ncbi:MAG: Glucosamine-6-phosphate deaminase [Anaerosolibacter sp.]|jgi:glucosamine-6-phosphate deaminase|uniref:glucosamine-6-phosphate deaminase n=1 Tax=Anaerosolibacter sp. TaxID=1872527 RepID=UPI00261D0CE1|nr:glucosamine-6-phosphate deaminase [Anaerosolibacter sp.]MDF2547591.1 Glucosamine-6-phosphate deaminase [Anaerosolibacter sp.]